MARGENKSYEAGEIWEFVDELRSAAGFESEGQFAIAAGFLPSSLSDWKHKKHVMSSLNLVRLLRAAAERRETAPLEAAAETSPVLAVLRRLEVLEVDVQEMQNLIARGFAALGVELLEAPRPGGDKRAKKAREGNGG